MWPRAAARRFGTASRQVSRVTQIRPKPLPTTTPLTKTAGVATLLTRYSPTARSDADASCRPRAMTSSSPAGDSAGVSSSETYLDWNMSKPDMDFDHIKSTMTCDRFRDSVWGFVIYRCSRGHQSAWDRMLQDLRGQVQESLRFYIRQDLLPFHDLHVIDDPEL
ncbi:hypothetical protein E4U21_005027 [Claviceps maximensis]|nr:hypothetical protein E4U21_005027 [Claviceps maximensis]